MNKERNLNPIITLVGPPNSGKTTLFNLLSGKNYKTVNYPGSTIEYHTSEIDSKFDCKGMLLDSPGIVSIVPGSPDEEVTIDSLFSNPKYGVPDLLLVTLDSSQLSRHLLLLKELISANFKVVAVLTMGDILAEKGFKINTEVLREKLGVDVLSVDPRREEDAEKVIEIVRKNLEGVKKNPDRESAELWRDSINLIETFKEIEEMVSQALLPVKEETFGEVNSEEINILPDKRTLKIDKVLLHPVWGLIIFFLVMALTFISIFWLAVPLMDLVDLAFAELNRLVFEIWGHNWLTELIANGVINGTGAVAIFVPQIMILFLILGFLEDTGYLARSAMLIDKPLSKIGLNGRSFVPMLSGFACAVPAILAARTIPNRRERILTIFIIPLISCSARLPVYVLLLSFLTPHDKLWIAGIGLAVIYVFGIAMALIVAAVINKLKKKIIRAEESTGFILELPSYKIPTISVVLRNMYLSTRTYISKAGPVILTFSLVMWFLTYFPNYNPPLEKDGLTQAQYEKNLASARLADSYASDLGKIIEPLMKPLGLDWRVGVALVTTFAAREVFVSSMALIFSVTTDENRLQSSIISSMRNAKIAGTNEPLFTTSKVIGLIVFFIIALQCISTLAISRQETGGWRIPLLQLTIYTSLAYFLAFLTIHGLNLLGVA
jgi:ferrous iron transport protein B